MNIVIKLILVALAAVFPKFKMGYGVFLIILMTFISLFCFFAAYADYTFGEPAWIVRNEILFGIASSIIGWVLGIALTRQSKRDAATMRDGVEAYDLKQRMDALKRDAENTDKD